MAKKDQFYFVHYTGYEDRVHDEIVLEGNLRPVNMRDGPSTDSIKWAVKSYPAELQDWIDSAESEKQIIDIWKRSGILSLQVREIGKESLFVLLGTTKSVAKSEAFLDVLIENQLEILQYEQENWKYIKQKEIIDLKKRSEIVKEVVIPSEFSGLVIGKQGANFKQI